MIPSLLPLSVGLLPGVVIDCGKEIGVAPKPTPDKYANAPDN